MLADDGAVLADHEALGIGLDLDRPADSAGGDRVFVVVEPHQTGLRHRRLGRLKAVKRAGDRHQLRPLRLEHFPDRAVAQLGMLVRLGVSNAAIEQPGVQLVITRYPQSRRKEPFAHQPDLVLDPGLRRGRLWPFSQPAAGMPATGSTR
jgi:hypothetical protein